MIFFKDLMEKQFWKDLVVQGKTPEEADVLVGMMRSRCAPAYVPPNKDNPLCNAENHANRREKIPAIKSYREDLLFRGVYPTLKAAKDAVEHFMDHGVWDDTSLLLAEKVRQYWKEVDKQC